MTCKFQQQPTTRLASGLQHVLHVHRHLWVTSIQCNSSTTSCTFGVWQVGIDDALVMETKEEIFELNNGCVCCTGQQTAGWFFT